MESLKHKDFLEDLLRINNSIPNSYITFKTDVESFYNNDEKRCLGIKLFIKIDEEIYKKSLEKGTNSYNYCDFKEYILLHLGIMKFKSYKENEDFKKSIYKLTKLNYSDMYFNGDIIRIYCNNILLKKNNLLPSNDFDKVLDNYFTKYFFKYCNIELYESTLIHLNDFIIYLNKITNLKNDKSRYELKISIINYTNNCIEEIKNKINYVLDKQYFKTLPIDMINSAVKITEV